MENWNMTNSLIVVGVLTSNFFISKNIDQGTCFQGQRLSAQAGQDFGNMSMCVKITYSTWTLVE